MAYETKVILISIAEYIKSQKQCCLPEEVNAFRKMYDYIVVLANAEGIVLKPFEETK